MTHLRKYGLLIVLLTPFTSFAKTVDQDFQRCAVAALQERQQTVGAVSVDMDGLNRFELDHDVSARQAIYRMMITDKSSGTDLGTVTCKLNTTGDLIAASFD